MQLRNALKIIKWEPEQAMYIITGKNGGRKPKIWSKIINFIALWDFQTGLINLSQVKFPSG